MILEIFGSFQGSSALGLWRGLVATIVLLAASACLPPPKGMDCLRIFLLAVAFACALSVLKTGTPPGIAAVYGCLVGLVIGAFASASSTWPKFLAGLIGFAALGAAASAAAYWSETLLK